VRLIGATTHNPFFFVNSPAVSRSQIFELQPLSEAECSPCSAVALAMKTGLGHLKVRVDDDALRHLARISDGDARKALTRWKLRRSPPAPRTPMVHSRHAAIAEQSIQKKSHRL